MRTEKEIRDWIYRLRGKIIEIESELDKDTSVEREEEIVHKTAEMEIEILHYQRCLGDV